MTRGYSFALAAALAIASATAQARDDRLLLPIDAALATPEAKDRLDDTVQFFWGDAPYAAPLQAWGTYTPLRRTNTLVKTDLESCEASFLLAIVALRDRAKEVGANAVVNIKSMYKNREFRSETQYECRAGEFATTVSLEGRLVKLPGPGPQAVVPPAQ